MAQRVLDYLGVNRLFIIRQLPWQADLLTVNNPTNKMVYIRFGGQDVPNANNYDAYVVPFSNLPIKCHSAFFALALEAAPTVLSVNTPSTARVTVTFSMGEEATSGTAYPVLQLSLANPDPMITVTADNTVLGPYDLSVWGGLLAFYAAGSLQVMDQWSVTYQHSADLQVWINAGAWPIWLSSTFALQLPRFQRYARLVIGRLTGTNPFGANFTVRPSLNEILSQTVLQTASAGLVQQIIAASANLSLPIFLGSAPGLALSVYSPPPNGVLWDMQVVGSDALASSIAVPLDYFNVPGAAGGNKADGTLLGNVAAYNGLFTNTLPWVTPTVFNRDTINAMHPIYSWRIPNAGQGTKPFDFNSYVDLQAIQANVALRSGGNAFTSITAVAASTWTRTALQLPSGSRIYAVTGGHNVAGTLNQIGYGDSVGVVQAIGLGYGSWNIGMGHNTGIVLTAPNNWIWVNGAAVGTIGNSVWIA